MNKPQGTRSLGEQLLSEPALARELTVLCDQAAAAWPALSIPRDEFIGYLETRLPAGEDIRAGIATLFPTDLYLAFACARGSSTAIRLFEQAHFNEVDRALRRVHVPGLQAADLEQMLREKLFVAQPGKPPKIVDYSGRGPLRVWVRVVVLRMLQNLATRGPKETPLEGDAIAQFPAHTNDPELEHIRERYRNEFQEAFIEAARAMDLRDRVLLHQRFAGGLTLDELAAAYDVHVNTVTRWLLHARRTLEANVKKILTTRLKLTEDQFQSVLRLVQSQIDMTLGRLLQPNPPEDDRGDEPP